MYTYSLFLEKAKRQVHLPHFCYDLPININHCRLLPNIWIDINYCRLLLITVLYWRLVMITLD